jgi:tRNA G37 N-methylase Trm5
LAGIQKNRPNESDKDISKKIQKIWKMSRKKLISHYDFLHKGRMPEHGDIEKETKKIFCGYWMTTEEWEDIHDYSPSEKFDDPNSIID